MSMILPFCFRVYGKKNRPKKKDFMQCNNNEGERRKYKEMIRNANKGDKAKERERERERLREIEREFFL